MPAAESLVIPAPSVPSLILVWQARAAAPSYGLHAGIACLVRPHALRDEAGLIRVSLWMQRLAHEPGGERVSDSLARRRLHPLLVRRHRRSGHRRRRLRRATAAQAPRARPGPGDRARRRRGARRFRRRPLILARRALARGPRRRAAPRPVSYTHLTLPT